MFYILYTLSRCERLFCPTAHDLISHSGKDRSLYVLIWSYFIFSIKVVTWGPFCAYTCISIKPCYHNYMHVWLWHRASLRFIFKRDVVCLWLGQMNENKTFLEILKYLSGLIFKNIAFSTYTFINTRNEKKTTP